MGSKRAEGPKRIPKSSSLPAGRPPSGPAGERVSEYPTLTVRLPQAAKDALSSLSALRRVPMWKLLAEMIGAYVDALPAEERKLLRAASKMTRSGE